MGLYDLSNTASNDLMSQHTEAACGRIKTLFMLEIMIDQSYKFHAACSVGAKFVEKLFPIINLLKAIFALDLGHYDLKCRNFQYFFPNFLLKYSNFWQKLPPAHPKIYLLLVSAGGKVFPQSRKYGYYYFVFLIKKKGFFFLYHLNDILITLLYFFSATIS